MAHGSVLRTSFALRNPLWFLLAAFLHAMFWALYGVAWVVIMAFVLLYRGGAYLVGRSRPLPFRSKDDVLGRGSIDDSPDVWV